MVAADLRGYGDSSAPEPGENSINYSFRSMALDQVEVMDALGFTSFYAAGHERGARTVHRMCLDHPDRVKKAAVVSIWRSYGDDVTGGPIDCGHYVNEEAPEETYGWFKKFFGEA